MSECTVIRMDVEPRWNYHGYAYDPELCNHEVCREDTRLHRLGYMHWSVWECPAGNCDKDRAKATCDREAGHDGGHLWYEPVPVLNAHIKLPHAPEAEVPA